jgi:hypothetical protein
LICWRRALQAAEAFKAVINWFSNLCFFLFFLKIQYKVFVFTDEVLIEGLVFFDDQDFEIIVPAC